MHKRRLELKTPAEAERQWPRIRHRSSGKGREMRNRTIVWRLQGVGMGLRIMGRIQEI
jgi:hypothetical protein